MDQKSNPWEQKSSEKSPVGTESIASISHSGGLSDDQEASMSSPDHAQSPEVSSKLSSDRGVNDNDKSMAEKLSAAILNIRAKEELVKQHAKVAEEAVAGWEKAEKEATVFRQKLEASVQKNSALEDRIGHLDGALKECVRQLRQAREEHEQKIQEALEKKTCVLESSKSELEKQLAMLQSQLENSKGKTCSASLDLDLRSKLETIEKENAALKAELQTQSIELKTRSLERDMSTQTAETASKQLLDSIKKVTKLEAECRRLRTMAQKSTSFGTDRRSMSPVNAESLTDSHSDYGERLYQVDTEVQKLGSLGLNDCDPSCSDSWASALITELDQFKNNKASSQNIMASLATSVELNLMDDFLEMERLAALSEAKSCSPRSEVVNVPNPLESRSGSPSKSEFQMMVQRIIDMEKELQLTVEQKVELERALSESQSQLEMLKLQLTEANQNLEELKRELDMAKEVKLADEVEIETMNARKKMVELQLEAASAEIQSLRGKVVSLEVGVEQERTLSFEIKARCQNLEKEIEQEKAMSAKMKVKYQNLEMEIEQERATLAEFKVRCQDLADDIPQKKHDTELHCAAIGNGQVKHKQDKELVMAAGKLAECQKTIASLGHQLKSLASLEDFLCDPQMAELNAGSLEGNRPYSHNDASITNGELIVGGSGPAQNGKHKDSPPSSTSSSSSSSGSGEKSRNGFGKLFSRSRGRSSRIENQ